LRLWISTKKIAWGFHVRRATFSIGTSLLKLRSSLELESAREEPIGGKEPGKRDKGGVDSREV